MRSMYNVLNIYDRTAATIPVREANLTERLADDAKSAAAQCVGPLSWEVVYRAAGQSSYIAETFGLPFGSP